jgi:hypothetical protein
VPPDRDDCVRVGEVVIGPFAVTNAHGPDRVRPRQESGGEAPVWHPRWTLQAFWDSELPEDVVSERGHPPLTERATRKILGGNLARLHGIDVEAEQREPAG